MRVIGRLIGLLAVVAGMALTGVELLGTEDRTVADHGLDLDQQATRAPEDVAARARIEFIGRMEIVCERWEERPYAGTAWTYEGTRERAVIELDHQASRLRIPRDNMRDLPPPPGEEAAVAELLAGYDQLVARFDAALAAGGFAHEEERLAFVAETEAAIAAQDWRLAAFGFTDCLDR
jgi:hypothetical protein